MKAKTKDKGLPDGVVLVPTKGSNGGRPRLELTKGMLRKVLAARKKGRTILQIAEELSLSFHLVQRTLKESQR